MSTTSDYPSGTHLLDLPEFLERRVDWPDCKRRVAIDGTQIPVFSQCLRRTQAVLSQAFSEGIDIGELVRGRAAVVDRMLLAAWQGYSLEQHTQGLALIAVGGYGRGELHPASDIDVMVLTEAPPDASLSERLAQFVTFLWDIGLKPGHSVRTLQECLEAARQDITVTTNLMESRLLQGSSTLFQTMKAVTGPDRIWPSRDFFAAKLAEQDARHHKFGDTAYKLEPNVKEGPGGLRDIQMIGWVTKRHFRAHALRELVDHQFLTEEEYRTLMAGQHFLWQVRFALHSLTGRAEDRLLFDHQHALAGVFGYSDDDANLAVEQVMQRYYRTVMELERLNEMLLQLYREAILHADDTDEPVAINRRFQSRKGYLEVTHDKVFEHYPPALLELFLQLQMHPGLQGVRASTIRLVRKHRHLIDDDFRNDVVCRSLFMEILRQPVGVTDQLRRMNRYGILAAYLPAFGAIVGRMQYDLFHVYTVDEHTLFVLRNLRRFALPEYQSEHPLCSQAFQQLPKPELLYLAGLFHDIAKGRGGDHSELGADEAEAFCRHHGLSDYDSRLVGWLVRHHLSMSMTAQRKDISDPAVIHLFAEHVGNVVRLNYLYLLTVGDIRATNPSLWNAWRDALLSELYQATKRVLRRGLDNPLDTRELVSEVQTEARRILEGRGLDAATCEAIWHDFDPDYFIRHSADEIAWHTSAIHSTRAEELPLVMIRRETARGSTEIFIYTGDHPNLFALTASALDHLGLDIVDARIITANSGLSLNTFLVLEDSGKPIEDDYRLAEIRQSLVSHLRAPSQVPSPVRRSTPRQLRHFHVATRISFTPDARRHWTVLELLTGDRAGLLSIIGRALMEAGVRVQNAKIATVGEQAEDILYITEQDGEPVAATGRQEVIRQLLEQALGEEVRMVDALA